MILRWVLILVTVILSWGSRVLARPQSSICAGAIENVYKQYQSLNQWSEIRITNKDQKAFQTPTKTLGVWLIRFESAGQVYKLKVLSSDQVKVFTLTSTCQLESSTEPSSVIDQKSVAVKPANYFTDENLRGLLAGDEGVIAVWSPRFVYSVTTLPEMAQRANKMKLQFTAILAHDVSEADLKKPSVAAIPDQYKRLNASTELLHRKSDLHLPIFFHYKNGQFLGEPLIGAYTPDAFESTIKGQL